MNRTVIALFCLAGALAPATAASISSFYPMYGPTNMTEYVTIWGTGFRSATPLKVWFNNTLCTDAYASFADGTQIQALVPYGATTGPIRVQVGTSPVAQSSQIFTVVGPGPFVYSFSPTQGSDNAPVTLVGMHFLGVTNVTFNGKRVPSLQPPAEDEQMQVLAPPGVTTGPIRVQSPKGSYTTTSNFFVPPLITNMSPASGRSGTNVLLRGLNFTGATEVYFSGQGGAFTLPGLNVTVASNNAMTVGVPVGATSGKLRLVAPAGSTDTTNLFKVQPLITGFSPASGPVSTSVTISGANLNASNLVVRFNNISASILSTNFGQLVARVPTGATTGPIKVETIDGSFTTPDLFYLPPAITVLSPSNSPPGSRITISGQNFTNAVAVSFNGFTAEFTVTNNTTIGATVPPGFATGPVVVSTPGGTATSPGLFYAPPLIGTFAPDHGLPGTNVVITGNNLLGTTTVLFGGVVATSFTVANNTTIQAVVPAGAQSGPITVVAPAGTNTSGLSFAVNYTSDLSATQSASPNPVLAGSNLVYSIRIENHGPFTAPEVAMTNVLPASVVVRSATSTHGSVSAHGGLVTGQLGPMNSGAGADITITVTPEAEGTLTNWVIVTGNLADPVLSNNSAGAVTTVQPLPLISARLTVGGSRVRIGWPLAWTNYVLQYRPAVGASGGWTDSTITPVQAGNEWVVTETNSAAARFYRLQRNP